jgi:hypothetical protein
VPPSRAAREERVALELDLGGAVTPTVGGVTSGGSAGGGIAGVVHAGYRVRAPLYLGVAIGGLVLGASRSERPYSVSPVGEPPNAGAVEDDLAVRAVLAGGTAGLHLGDRWPVVVRLAAGGAIASVADTRSGEFHGSGGQSYTSGTLTYASGASFFFLAPEVRLGARIGERLVVSGGVGAFFLLALDRARWEEERLFSNGQGAAVRFSEEDMTGSAIVVFTPSVGVRYAF